MKKIAQILPLRKMPRSVEVFDYFIPESLADDISAGAIVEMEFKKSKIFGLVVGFSVHQPGFELKSIIRIIDKDLIAKYQIELISWFSEFYHHSLASTAQLMLPEIPKRRSNYAGNENGLMNKGTEEKKTAATNDLMISETMARLAKEIIDSEEKGYLLLNQNTELTDQLYVRLIKKHIDADRQILLLFPTLADLEVFRRRLPDNIADLALILDSKTYKSSKNKYLRYYQAIASASAKVLLGTRSAIFFNLMNVRTVIIDRSESDDYKQWDQNPRYDAGEVLFRIAKLTSAKLIVSGFAPKPETYFAAQKQRFKLINLGKNIPEAQVRRVEFSVGGDDYYLTENLDKFIKHGLEKNEQILLLVNKRGYASTLKCADCQKVISCSICGLPLTVYPESRLFCHHCLKYTVQPTLCPQCGGASIRATGIGAMGFEALIRKKYASPNIMVGLPSINDGNLLFDRAAFVYFDSLFYLPDFSHPAKVFYLLRKFTQKLYSQNPNIKILIQSAFLENHAVAYFNRPLEFYKKELKARQLLNYPPYFNMIKIIVRDKFEKKAKQKIDYISGKISGIQGIEPSAPYAAYSVKIRDYFIWQIAVKVFDQQAEKVLIKAIPNDIIVDKNPINLL
ncbi:MAG: hypothetical protein ACOZBH_05305 [Patescibacteria group bacterium]